MRVVFIGATRFGLRCLVAAQALDGIEIVGSVSAPPTFSISYRPEGVSNVLHAEIEPFCGEHGIPCISIGADGMRGEPLLEQVKHWRPDAFLVAGWFHMIPKAWRDVAPAYGLHASLLPDYSGGAPLVWAMINGEPETGITLFQLGDGVDDGPILGQARTSIVPSDTIATLYARIEQLGVDLITEHLPSLAKGDAVLVAQDESRRRVVPQRSPEDGLIDWTNPADRIHDFIRAQTKPYPGAFTLIGEDKLTIWAARPSDKIALRPGEVGGTADRPLIGCGDGRGIELVKVAVNGIDVSLSDWSRLRQQRTAPPLPGQCAK
jgi:methionyl-tRNA formyltransferase